MIGVGGIGLASVEAKDVGTLSGGGEGIGASKGVSLGL